MSIRHFQYVPTPTSRIESGRRWLQNTFNLRDWTVELYHGNIAPDWVIDREFQDHAAAVQFHQVYMIAEIWICPAHCKQENRHPLQSLVHEFLHIVVDMAQPDEAVDDHPTVVRLEHPLTKLMFIENKWKLPPVRPLIWEK